MALLTATSVPGQTKVGITPAAVSSSDTISASDIGQSGALLIVTNNSGGSINVTIADPNTTTVGNVGTTTAQPLAAANSGFFRILQGHVNLSTGVATVAFSGTTSVTYQLIRG